MKRTALILTAAFVATAGVWAADFSADTVKSGNYVHVPAGEVLRGGTVLTGAVVVVDGDVDGDLMAFAAYVEVNGNVTGDLLAAAATIIVNGKVAGSAQCYGAAVSNAGSVAGSLEAAGAALFLRGSVGGDVDSAGVATWVGALSPATSRPRADTSPWRTARGSRATSRTGPRSSSSRPPRP